MSLRQLPSGGREASDRLWRLGAAGMELTGTILGFGFVGWLLDRWLGTKPWLLLVGLLLGGFGAMYKFVRLAKALNRSDGSAGGDSPGAGRTRQEALTPKPGMDQARTPE